MQILEQFMLTLPNLEWTGPAHMCRCGCVSNGDRCSVVYMFRTADAAWSAIQALCQSPHSVNRFIFHHTDRGVLVSDN